MRRGKEDDKSGEHRRLGDAYVHTTAAMPGVDVARSSCGQHPGSVQLRNRGG